MWDFLFFLGVFIGGIINLLYGKLLLLEFIDIFYILEMF